MEDRGIAVMDEIETRIRAAIAEIRARGVAVRGGPPGVIHGDYSSRWIVDDFGDGVSPIGALLVNRTTRADMAYAAAAEATGAAALWLVGFDDGFGGIERAAARAVLVYQDGYDRGQRFRQQQYDNERTTT